MRQDDGSNAFTVCSITSVAGNEFHNNTHAGMDYCNSTRVARLADVKKSNVRKLLAKVT